MEVKHLSSGQYSVKMKTRFKTSMLRWDLGDNSYAHIVVRERKSIEDNDSNNQANENQIFKISALFRSCISKFNNTTIDKVNDLDIVMPMYNLLEYSTMIL